MTLRRLIIVAGAAILVGPGEKVLFGVLGLLGCQASAMNLALAHLLLERIRILRRNSGGVDFDQSRGLLPLPRVDEFGVGFLRHFLSDLVGRGVFKFDGVARSASGERGGGEHEQKVAHIIPLTASTVAGSLQVSISARPWAFP